MTNPTPGLGPGVRERVQEIFHEAKFLEALGIEYVDCGLGWCAARVPLDDRHEQQDGFVHAGVVATLADHAAGAAAYTHCPPDKVVLTIEFKINLLRPAVGDALRARANVLRPGRTIATVESDVFAERNGEEKHVAKALVTLAYAPTKPAQ